MSPFLVTFIALFIYWLAYRLYALYLGKYVFEINNTRQTPAHVFRDDIDYGPSNRFVLFGHQFASITGLSPMLGPAIAVIWGWLPAMIWIIIGAVFIGAVQDFGALVVSIRARGVSLGKVTEQLVGRRQKHSSIS